MKSITISISITILLGAINVLAAPTMSNEDVTFTRIVDSQSTEYDWAKDWVKSFPIHSSCNNTQYNQLSKGLEEAQLVAAHARDHTLKFGRESDFYEKYFGNAPSGAVIGWFDAVVHADKKELLFRCDDIDGNCKNDGWAGHWRGSNATNETVICDLSFTSRLYLSQMCSQGYTVSGFKDSVFWAGDLLHRVWHTSVLGQDTVGHYADTFKECLELAKNNSTEAINNSASLRYYALDVYAYDIAVPGTGCSGEDSEESSNTPTSTTSTTTGGSECHTHADGETHCV